MLALEGVEERLRAIAWELERLRQDGTPGYMRTQSLERIESQVQVVRQSLERPLAELAVVHRVADILSSRMVEAFLSSADVQRHIEGTVQRAVAQGLDSLRAAAALRALAAGHGSAEVVVEWLPAVRAIDPSSPYAAHAVRLAVSAYVAGEEADRATSALLEWAMLRRSEVDRAATVCRESELERDE